jgi:hypothetical protein
MPADVFLDKRRDEVIRVVVPIFQLDSDVIGCWERTNVKLLIKKVVVTTDRDEHLRNALSRILHGLNKQRGLS